MPVNGCIGPISGPPDRSPSTTTSKMSFCLVRFEVPVIIEGLIEEVEAVQTANPADTDAHVQIVPVVLESEAFHGVLSVGLGR